MSRYVQAHQNITGPGDSRPTALQIIQDEHLTGALTDKVALLTGGTNGFGLETLKALHATGMTIYFTCRDLIKASSMLTTLGSPPNLIPIQMHLDSLTSVRTAAAQVLEKTSKLNLLICNAGIMASPFSLTADGYELQFATNHLGHFLLFELLKPALLAAATPAYPSRVVTLTSIGHRAASVRFDDLNFSNGESYDRWAAYGQSKTANVWMANYIDRHYGAENLHALSVHPGGAVTGLYTYVYDLPEMQGFADDEEIQRTSKTVEQGAATTVLAAVAAEWEGKGGRYLADCAEQGPMVEGTNWLSNGDCGYVAWTYEEEGEERLWRESLKMVGL